MFSSARIGFYQTLSGSVKYFQPLHKWLCKVLLLKDYRVSQASFNTVCGNICGYYIVKITRTIDPWGFAREQLTTENDTTQRGSSFLFGNNEHGF